MAATIRSATLADASKIARFHAEVWRKTYRDLAPREALILLDTAHRVQSWQAKLAKVIPRQHSLMAIDDDEIVGLVHFGPTSDPAFGDIGEIRHLYISKSQQSKGLGRGMMATAFRQMLRDGFSAAVLAVVQGNEAAIGFYRRLGGVSGECFVDTGPIWKSQNQIIHWPDLETALLER